MSTPPVTRDTTHCIWSTSLRVPTKPNLDFLYGAGRSSPIPDCDLTPTPPNATMSPNLDFSNTSAPSLILLTLLTHGCQFRPPRAIPRCHTKYLTWGAKESQPPLLPRASPISSSPALSRVHNAGPQRIPTSTSDASKPSLPSPPLPALRMFSLLRVTP